SGRGRAPRPLSSCARHSTGGWDGSGDARAVTSASVAVREASVAVGPSAAMLASSAAISTVVSSTRCTPGRVATRTPPPGPGREVSGTPTSRSRARSRSTVRVVTPSSVASWAVVRRERTSSSTRRCCRSTRRSVGCGSREAADDADMPRSWHARRPPGPPRDPDTGRSGSVPSVVGMSDIQTFFDRYARALSEIDHDALAELYDYPALAGTRQAGLAVVDPAQTRRFFAANGRRYKDQGVDAVRIVDPRPGYDERGLWWASRCWRTSTRPARWSASSTTRTCSSTAAPAGASRSPRRSTPAERPGQGGGTSHQKQRTTASRAGS